MMTRTLLHCALFTAISSFLPVAAQPESTEIDRFMEKVLQRRDVNWKEMQTYLFHERELLKIQGEDIPPIAGFDREFVWIARQEELLRSPVKVDGVSVSQKEQLEYENDWKKKHSKKRDSIRRETFFEFKFEPGNYYFVGREDWEGREVVVIEYYPKHLFSDDDDDPDKETDEETDEEEEEFERMFNKTSLVRLWIVPEIHQIAKITLTNVGLEFLPFRWLVRIDDLEATLVMDTPIADVWLPREITASVRVSTANNYLDISYSREFSDYREADVKVKFSFEEPQP
jgi:hypothetical protein